MDRLQLSRHHTIDEVMQGSPRRVVPLLGFEWGFDIRPN
jgi:hypothetical protein